ncbi:MAG: hypothetical protein ACTSSP_04075 [Candidatus Asgardarchaeia archaeon]
MDEEAKKFSGVNINEPAVEVKHAELKRLAHTESLFRSECPVCKIGVLLVRRDQETLEITAEDMCILCGQKFVYVDIEDLREMRMRESKEINVQHVHFYGECAKIGWVIDQYGYGELTFYMKDDQIMCDDETIGKEKIRAVLNYMADNVVCTGE